MSQTKTRHRKSVGACDNSSNDPEEISLGLGRSPKTELVQRLLAARREFFAREGRFLDRDEIERERRGDWTADAGG